MLIELYEESEVIRKTGKPTRRKSEEKRRRKGGVRSEKSGITKKLIRLLH